MSLLFYFSMFVIFGKCHNKESRTGINIIPAIKLEGFIEFGVIIFNIVKYLKYKEISFSFL